MPPMLNTQRIIAFVWDFDKTLTHGYMQDPLFDEYGINSKDFWDEVNALPEKWENLGLRVSKDTVYLSHILEYVRNGKFKDLSNAKLRGLGATIQLAPGAKEFMSQTQKFVADNSKYAENEIQVEHYVVSTGLRQMIEGSGVRDHVKDIWACELLPDINDTDETDINKIDQLPLSSIGYTIDNTTKTRAVFEINKGVNVYPTIDVNSRMDESERRVPFKNMIYIADGPSDVPVFSVINKSGGKTFGVHIGGFTTPSYKNVKQLHTESRINSMGPADYQEGTSTYDMLMSALEDIADDICKSLAQQVDSVVPTPTHITD
ncbi:haloacid dehalogenase-like hydrolase [Corynebacterium casei]|uniref:haloacid dehalogenase-like hydrolase n=1 Tax=Corynebacterium casei TaxID=160386 RepID=UPI003FCFF6DB